MSKTYYQKEFVSIITECLTLIFVLVLLLQNPKFDLKKIFKASNLNVLLYY